MGKHLLFALLAIIPGIAQAQNWTVIPMATDQSLNAINSSFTNRYIVGDGGFVAESDGGLVNWTVVDVGTSGDLIATHRPSGGQIWVSGDSGVCRVFYSGVWHDGSIPNSAEDFIVCSRSSGWSFAAGTGGSIYRSTNLGVSWQLQQSGTTNALHDGNGSVSSLAFVVGDNGTILKTTNGGVDWVQKPTGTTANLYAYLEVVTGVLAAAGEDGTILRSTDDGESWTAVDSGTNATIHDLTTSWVSGFQVLAVGEGGLVLQSTDAGASWCRLNSETDVDLYACEWSAGQTLLVMGAGGYMAMSSNGAGGCFDPATVEEPFTLAGIQIDGPWPQPLSGEGRIEFEAESARHLRADVFDAMGRKVESLCDQTLNAGQRHAFDFDASSWSSGAYFVRVTTDEGVVSRRVLVVR
ncbi:MAG: T9SS type A sorting domain-containing protein [Candidatus Eisenbacteria bacterium]|uniref:T9SS type A sorting domain-containing protein n=1 Tax=Eiseniibacteriota bacterium TaxID=2212470 RepID=A0A956SEL0_UNCEI|nr:T9SS type A sorting domain-containing protein [Candidatus Eisenbacteria bacterium]MCB9465898.1 T9SS type A sorting domain-containing protein [Candidatus Eisenbacteria bacterium]